MMLKVVEEDVEEGVSMKSLLKKMQGCGVVVWCGVVRIYNFFKG